jgi:hypothetical protein
MADVHVYEGEVYYNLSNWQIVVFVTGYTMSLLLCGYRLKAVREWFVRKSKINTSLY